MNWQLFDWSKPETYPPEDEDVVWYASKYCIWIGGLTIGYYKDRVAIYCSQLLTEMHTYEWDPLDTGTTNDPRVDYQPTHWAYITPPEVPTDAHS